MVAYAKEKGVAEKLNLITNGVLLTKKNSLSLIESGIDTIKISLQGMTSEQYFNTCGTNVDFQKFIDNIRFFV